MFWRIDYSTPLFNYIDWFMADSYSEAIEKAELLTCGARYKLTVAPLGVLWGNR